MEESLDFMSIFAIIIIILVLFIYLYQKNKDKVIFKYLDNYNYMYQSNNIEQENSKQEQFYNIENDKNDRIQLVNNSKNLPTHKLGPVEKFHQSFSNFSANRLGWRKKYDLDNQKDIPTCNEYIYNNFENTPTKNYLNNLENTKNPYL